MAVIFGVPQLAPLGMMPNSHNVEVGEGRAKASSERVRAEERPQIRSEVGR